MLEYFVKCSTYRLPECTVRKLSHDYNRDRVFVYYGDNTYNHSVKRIMDLCNAIKEDYPEMEDKDIEVHTIGSHESDRHAYMTMICVNIPIDDYLKMRNANEINIL
jgi:hypothetical protein